MATFLVRHTVDDYAKWKAEFDAHSATRKAAGSKEFTVLRSADNPNDIVIFFEWDSHGNARTFSNSEDLKQIMQKAGVQGIPDMVYLNEDDHGHDDEGHHH